jgi:hypothetical protein
MRNVVCIVALLGLFGPAARSQPAPEQSPQSIQQQSNPDQRGSEQAPFIIKIVPPQDAQAAKAAPAEREDGADHSWSGSFRGWGLSDKIAAIASLAALFQLLALLAAVLLMFRTSRRQLRAYVSMNGGSVRLVDDPNGEQLLEGYVKLKNFGNTPAYEFRSYAMIKVLNVNAPPFEETSQAAGRGLLGPGAETDLSVFWRVSEGDMAAIRAGTKRIFVWGEAYYVDAFRKNRYFKFYNVNAVGELAGLGWTLTPADKATEAN